MKKRLFGILLCFALMLTMMPVTALTMQAEASVNFLTIGSDGVNSDETNASGTKWRYTNTADLKNPTLYLEGVQIDMERDGIFYSGKQDLNIVLSSDNTVAGSYAGIYGCESGNIIISGDGSLTATGTENCGIRTDKSLTINGGNVTATSTEGDAITASSNVNIIGGIVKATSSEYATAILANGGNIIIDSSEVVAKGGYRALNGTDVIVNNSIVSAEGYAAIYAENVEITDSKIHNSKGSISAYPDYFSDEAVLKIKDSMVITEAETNVLAANSINIENTGSGKYSTYVEATATGGMEQSGLSTNDKWPDMAIVANVNSLKIDEKLDITDPEGGEVGNYENEVATIMKNGEPAAHVIIEIPKHDITVEKTPGGKVKVEPEKASEGEEVKVVATPDEGYEVDKIIVVDADGKETDITAKGSFIMGKSNVTVKVTFKKKASPAAAGPLLAKMTAKGKTSMKITWNKVKGAQGYDIYLSRCNYNGKKLSPKKVKTIKGNKTLKWTKKGLKTNTAYKGYVRAWKKVNGKKKYFRTSLTVHAFTAGGDSKLTNSKAVTVKKKSVTLSKGKTYRIKASVKKLQAGKKLIGTDHTKKLRYVSSNKKVATVSKSGKITAKGKGSCKVYAVAASGAKAAVKVTVK